MGLGGGLIPIFTARKRSLGQGNIFTGVRLSTGGRRVVAGTPTPETATEARGNIYYWNAFLYTGQSKYYLDNQKLPPTGPDGPPTSETWLYDQYTHFNPANWMKLHLLSSLAALKAIESLENCFRIFKRNSLLLFFGGSESHLSGCFRLFAPKLWKVVGIYKWYLVILWMQLEWWRQTNPVCCNLICSNLLYSLCSGDAKTYACACSRPGHLVKF